MKSPTDLARECGADVVQRFEDQGGVHIEFTESQFVAFTKRLRGEVIEECAVKCDGEVAALTRQRELRPALAVGVCAAAIRSMKSPAMDGKGPQS